MIDDSGKVSVAGVGENDETVGNREAGAPQASAIERLAAYAGGLTGGIPTRIDGVERREHAPILLGRGQLALQPGLRVRPVGFDRPLRDRQVLRDLG